MIPALMLVFSMAALVQFFLSYCRSLLASCTDFELSSASREVIGMSLTRITGREFYRLMALIHIAGGSVENRWSLRAIGMYYRLARLVGLLFRLSSAARAWSLRESTRCACFAALVLDHRIGVMAQ